MYVVNMRFIVYLCRFFFQGCRGNVLYTGECIVYITGERDREKVVCVCMCVFYAGDFRLTLEETKRLRSLHSGGRYIVMLCRYLLHKYISTDTL